MLGAARLLHSASHIHSARTGSLPQGLFPVQLLALSPSSWANSGQSSDQDQRVVISTAVLFQDSIRGSLRRFQSGQAFDKFAPNAIRSKNHSVSLCDRKHRGLKARQIGTDNTGALKQFVLRNSFLGASAHQYPLNIPHTDPRHHAMHGVNGSEA
jgi:hypothetical protein